MSECGRVSAGRWAGARCTVCVHVCMLVGSQNKQQAGQRLASRAQEHDAAQPQAHRGGGGGGERRDAGRGGGAQRRVADGIRHVWGAGGCRRQDSVDAADEDAARATFSSRSSFGFGSAERPFVALTPPRNSQGCALCGKVRPAFQAAVKRVAGPDTKVARRPERKGGNDGSEAVRDKRGASKVLRLRCAMQLGNRSN